MGDRILEEEKGKTRTLRSILDACREGEIDLETAERELNLFSIEKLSEIAAIDPSRHLRRGVPEVVLADSKSPEEAAEIALALFRKNGYAFLTRVDSLRWREIVDAFEQNDIRAVMHYNEKGRTLIIRDENTPQSTYWGKVGIITAGTSDIPVAEEAREACEFMGCEVIRAYDIGISALHRLFSPLIKMLEKGVSVIVVAAGMEGALPSVVSGLVPVPVIGVPTPIGYGFGGRGEAALKAMLQSCSPGLVVVNIGNGFGAGITAALIARQARGKSKK